MATHACKHESVAGAGPCGETFSRIADLRAHSKEVHGVDLSPRSSDVTPGDAPAGTPTSPEVTSEVAPGSDAPPKPSLAERARNALASKPKEDKPAARKARKSARVSLADGFSGFYRWAGNQLIMSQLDVPVGRALVYQSDRAGQVFDGLIADTIVDKTIQPLAHKGKAMAEVGSLALLPLLVGAYERTGNPAIELMLRRVMTEHLEAMLPIIASQREEEAKYAQIVRDMGLDPGADAIGAVLREMFAPVSGAEGPDGSGDGLEEATSPGPDGVRAAV